MGLALIVEDSPTEMGILQECLQRAGVGVTKATTSGEALNQIRLQRPDVIILDVVLPDRSGFELCRELKADPSTGQIPIVMCSTKNTDMDRYWGMKQGASAYLTKPVDQEQLVRVVKSFLNS